jgi:hypothetical protein
MKDTSQISYFSLKDLTWNLEPPHTAPQIAYDVEIAFSMEGMDPGPSLPFGIGRLSLQERLGREGVLLSHELRAWFMC